MGLPEPNEPRRVAKRVDRNLEELINIQEAHGRRLERIEKFFVGDNGQSMPERLRRVEDGITDIKNTQEEAVQVRERVARQRITRGHALLGIMLSSVLTVAGQKYLLPKPAIDAPVQVSTPAVDTEALKRDLLKAVIEGVSQVAVPEPHAVTSRRTRRKSVDPPSAGLIDSTKNFPRIP